MVQADGAITATANGVAYGVHALTYLNGYVDVTTGGAITVTAYAGSGYGVVATTSSPEPSA